MKLLLPLLALLLGIAVVGWDIGLDGYGTPSDEQAYFEATRRHVRWITEVDGADRLDPAVLEEHWNWKPGVVIHPSFSRLLSGIGWSLLHGGADGLGGLGVDEIIGFRAHQALAFGLLALGVVVFARRRIGSVGAVAALVFLLAHVRLVGHAHSAMPDTVLTCLWLWATILTADAKLEDTWRRPLLVALLVGLALATKLTGVGLWGLLLVWTIWSRGRRCLPAVLLLALLPPLVFYALTPQSWPDLAGWTSGWLGQFGAREGEITIPTLFLGERYLHRLPWWAPGLALLMTTPPALLGLSAVSLVSGLRALVAGPLAALRSPWTLLALSGLAPLAAASLPSIPAHGMTRLFLPLHPCVALFAAAGLVRLGASKPLAGLSRWIPGPPERRGAWLLLVLLGVPALVIAARFHGFELTYFNAFVGGPAGAQKAGMDVALLKLEVNQEVLDQLNEHLPPGARLMSNFVHVDLENHQRDGRLRADIQLVKMPPFDHWLIYGRRSWMSPPGLQQYERFADPRATPKPLYRKAFRGVDLVQLHRVDVR